MVVVLALFAVPTATASARAAQPGWLVRLNSVRADDALPPVRIDTSGVAGLKAHLAYLHHTPTTYLSGRYASAHSENPSSPYYSRAGATEAERSDLAFGTSSDVDAINRWLSAPFHAVGMLRQQLTAVAFYRDPATGSAGLDITTHLGGRSTRSVVYPRRQLSLARAAGEVPDPLQTCRRQHPSISWRNAGFPVVAMVHELRSYKTVTAWLRRPDGSVERPSTSLCLADLRTYVSDDAVYGATGRAILTADHVIMLISPHPLTRGRYAVRIGLGSNNGNRHLAWKFVSQAS